MNQIRPNIFLGNSKDARHTWSLTPVGITAVLNVADDLDYPHDPDLSYWKEGLIDGPGNSIQEFEAAVHRLDRLLQLGHKVLIHCHMGMSRSPIVLAKYLALKEHRTLQSCIEELAKLRPIVNPHRALIALANQFQGPLQSQRN